MLFSEMIYPANLLTGTKHPAFSTNQLADTNETKHNCNRHQRKNLNKHIRKLQTCAIPFHLAHCIFLLSSLKHEDTGGR